MAVKIVFNLLGDMFLIFLWRLLLRVKNKFDVQKKLHELPKPIPLLFQWPCLMCIMLVYFMWISMHNIVTVDMEQCHFLDQDLMTEDVIDAQANQTQKHLSSSKRICHQIH